MGYKQYISGESTVAYPLDFVTIYKLSLEVIFFNPRQALPLLDAPDPIPGACLPVIPSVGVGDPRGKLKIQKPGERIDVGFIHKA